MNAHDAAILFVTGVGAGAFGAILGLGGGIIMVPVLSQALGVSMDKAVAASLLGIVATSSASSVEYLSSKKTDLDLASQLLLASVLGALVGTFIGKPLLGTDDGRRIVAGLFSVVTLIISGLMFRHNRKDADEIEYSTPSPTITALSAVFGGGVISTLLGVGGGAINVPAITLAVKAPMKIAAATSAYMIGVTAASGVAVYAWSGMVDPAIAGPCALGLLVGGVVGARAARYVGGVWLRRSFACILVYLAYTMARRALGG